MVDSTFWKTKASELDQMPAIRAEYSFGGNDIWHLIGPQGAIDAFQSIAGLLAVASGCPNGDDAWKDWLNLIRRHSSDFDSDIVVEVRVPEVDPGPRDYPALLRTPLRKKRSPVPKKLQRHKEDLIIDVRSGTITDVCRTSARFCRELVNESEKVELAGRRAARKEYKTALGRTIDGFRKECGWTFEELATTIAMSKDAVLDHVHKGTQPRPDALKSYADAFSSKLGRVVSVNELESV